MKSPSATSAVSVPSGGSWWEQRFVKDGVGTLASLFQYPLVGRGGSNINSSMVRNICRHGFSTLWWVVVGATQAHNPLWESPWRFQYPLVGRGGSNGNR